MSISILDNFEYLFDGCCRGKAINAKNQGDMSHAECATKCDEKQDCIAIETNGWNKEEGQHGPCYFFTESTEKEITNGRCITNGDQKCFAKVEKDYVQLSNMLISRLLSNTLPHSKYSSRM